jgi:hypothetical protein
MAGRTVCWPLSRLLDGGLAISRLLAVVGIIGVVGVVGIVSVVGVIELSVGAVAVVGLDSGLTAGLEGRLAERWVGSLCWQDDWSRRDVAGSAVDKGVKQVVAWKTVCIMVRQEGGWQGGGWERSRRANMVEREIGRREALRWTRREGGS